MRMTEKKGFTLIELLIVVVIIGILAAIAIPKFANTKEKAYVASMKSDLRNMATSEEAYFADNQTYTTSLTAMNFTASAVGHRDRLRCEGHGLGREHEAPGDRDHLSGRFRRRLDRGRGRRRHSVQVTAAERGFDRRARQRCRARLASGQRQRQRLPRMTRMRRGSLRGHSGAERDAPRSALLLFNNSTRDLGASIRSVGPPTERSASSASSASSVVAVAVAHPWSRSVVRRPIRDPVHDVLDLIRGQRLRGERHARESRVQRVVRLDHDPQVRVRVVARGAHASSARRAATCTFTRWL